VTCIKDLGLRAFFLFILVRLLRVAFEMSKSRDVG
jgi:hypothetical protein